MRKLTLLLLLVTLPLTAQSLREDMVVTTTWLDAHLERVRLIEVGDRTEFERAHIPGAVLIEPSSLIVERDGVPNELPEVAALESVFSLAGLGDDARVIIYSRDPLLAARTWFTLDHLGHGERAALLDGGFARWIEEKRRTSSGRSLTSRVEFHARVRPTALTDLAAVRDLVRMREIVGKTLVMIDARPPEQYSGAQTGNAVKRAGHIPGAVNIPWTDNVTTGEISRLLPEAELRDLYNSAGVTQKTTNLVYCRTGMQATMTYFVLRYLGYDATLYDGSFVEWSMEPQNVVETSLTTLLRISAGDGGRSGR